MLHGHIHIPTAKNDTPSLVAVSWAGCFSQTAKHSVVGSVLIERYRQCNPSPSLKCEKANNTRGLARDAREATAIATLLCCSVSADSEKSNI